MRNLLLIMVAPVAFGACAANMDSDATEEGTEVAEQALGPESPYPSPGGPAPGGHDFGGPGHGWGGGYCNDPQYAPYCDNPQPNQRPHPDQRPHGRIPDQQRIDAENQYRARLNASYDARDSLEHLGATVLETQELKHGKGIQADAKACQYACNIVRATACSEVKLACSMGLAAVEIIPGAPVACVTLIAATCYGGSGFASGAATRRPE
jgi:hypothetical protein